MRAGDATVRPACEIRRRLAASALTQAANKGATLLDVDLLLDGQEESWCPLRLVDADPTRGHFVSISYLPTDRTIEEAERLAAFVRLLGASS